VSELATDLENIGPCYSTLTLRNQGARNTAVTRSVGESGTSESFTLKVVLHKQAERKCLLWLR
jgi:hypothetical protein